MNDALPGRRFSVRGLASPAVLFALAALFIGLPGLVRLAAPHAPPRIEIRSAPAHVPGGPFIIERTLSNVRIGAIEPFAFAGPFGAVFFLSLPVFALTYALWPRAFRRALRADLGRWHAAFAIVPALLAPALVLLVFVLLTPFAMHAAGADPHGFATAMTARSTTFLASVHYAVAALWLTGLAIFGVNALDTLRRRGPADG